MVETPVSRGVYKCVYTKVKSVYIVSKLVCILLAKWCVGIGDPHFPVDVGPAHSLIPWCSALLVQIRGKPATNQPLKQGYIITRGDNISVLSRFRAFISAT